MARRIVRSLTPSISAASKAEHGQLSGRPDTVSMSGRKVGSSMAKAASMMTINSASLPVGSIDVAGGSLNASPLTASDDIDTIRPRQRCRTDAIGRLGAAAHGLRGTPELGGEGGACKT